MSKLGFMKQHASKVQVVVKSATNAVDYTAFLEGLKKQCEQLKAHMKEKDAKIPMKSWWGLDGKEWKTKLGLPFGSEDDGLELEGDSVWAGPSQKELVGLYEALIEEINKDKALQEHITTFVVKRSLERSEERATTDRLRVELDKELSELTTSDEIKMAVKAFALKHKALITTQGRKKLIKDLTEEYLAKVAAE